MDAVNLKSLIESGVVIPAPSLVMIADDVDPSRIEPGAVLHPGARISGPDTFIGAGSVLGREGPVTVDNCRLGRDVDLAGGYHQGAVYWHGASMGSGAHVRSGTILEEQANGAHTVGFKQTILLPFVTTGSLINFCDCLMAGGTSRKNHSEVGSSYIHFNFTPHQDKATPSLIGDVPRGVMMREAPIFLGGQGGMVGPVRVEYGTVIPAGTILRSDVKEAGRLAADPARVEKLDQPYDTTVYRRARRIFTNNLIYIGNLYALHAWYRVVRNRFASTPSDQACLDGGLACLDLLLEERIKRIGAVADKLPASIEALRHKDDTGGAELSAQQDITNAWPAIAESLPQTPASVNHPPADTIDRLQGERYLDAIRTLSEDDGRQLTTWLQSIVNDVTGRLDAAFNKES